MSAFARILRYSAVRLRSTHRASLGEEGRESVLSSKGSSGGIDGESLGGEAVLESVELQDRAKESVFRLPTDESLQSNSPPSTSFRPGERAKLKERRKGRDVLIVSC